MDAAMDAEHAAGRIRLRQYSSKNQNAWKWQKMTQRRASSDIFGFRASSFSRLFCKALA
jgi:hypothetical protein